MKKLFRMQGPTGLAKRMFGGGGGLNVPGLAPPARGSGFGKVSPIGVMGTPKVRGNFYQVPRQRPQLRGAATKVVGRLNALKLRRR